MLGQIIGSILGIIFVILVFKCDRLYKVRNKVNSLFWEDIFYSDNNSNKPGIRIIKLNLRFAQIMYLYFGMTSLIWGIINFEFEALIFLPIFIVIWPLMFRFTMRVQRKFWDIN